MNGYVLHDFAKADRDWLEPLLAAIAENAPLLAKGDDATFMNRVHLATADEDERAEPKPDRRDGAGRAEPQADAPPEREHRRRVRAA